MCEKNLHNAASQKKTIKKEYHIYQNIFITKQFLVERQKKKTIFSYK
jgi:hypothetical protein